MAELLKMPRLSDTMEVGTIVTWHKKVGDKVNVGDLLVEIETDKATMEFESPYEGVLLHIFVKEGESAPVDAPLAIIGQEGEDISDLIKQVQQPTKEKTTPTHETPPKTATTNQTTITEQKTEEPSPPQEGRIKASPLAKRLAKEFGIDLSKIKGSGPEGRIIKRDVLEYVEKAKETTTPTPPIAFEEAYEDKPVSSMRLTIAKRLSESKFTAPHYYLTVNVYTDALLKLKQDIKEIFSEKVSVTDILVKLSAIALTKHPEINASWLGDKIRYYKHVHIGVAVAVEDGLVVPVIRFANHKSLTQISRELKELIQKAREKKLKPEELQGSTFTISNLGMFGIDQFTAIINPPEAAILAVGRTRREVEPDEDGSLKIVNKMAMTMSCDHRVIDGATGARFLQTLKALLENPSLALL
ncbi:MAG: pyruvate dehydrogenase complex dihydrolipoamide acetyltransferase [Chlorobi bacterium]|nr:pyruvate dehydrogenase complex dihydrolipoamide acetyltransferase [Chlorobiota bacterium]